MSSDLKFQALELAVRSGPNATAEGIVKTAEVFFNFLSSNATTAPAGKATKAVKDTPAPKTETPAETVKEEVKADTPPAVTQDEVKAAVIALVNAGNKAAGNDKTGREYAGAVLQPFGAKNVSTIKPEDYAKVLEALKAKQKAVEDEAALVG